MYIFPNGMGAAARAVLLRDRALGPWQEGPEWGHGEWA